MVRNYVRWMEKYKNKYRIKSHRKPNWDYSADAFYFLTIVTQNRACNLGEIVVSKSLDGYGRVHLQPNMILSDFGNIVEREWFQSFEIRNELILHQFVLMPNHLHAIVEICNENRDEMDRNEMILQTHDRVSLSSSPSIELSSIKRNPPLRLPKSISSFMGGFKSSVNTKIDDYIDEYQLGILKYNRQNHFFQPNYHDHIIRNEKEYHAIYHYIEKNPLKWAEDKFYGKKIRSKRSLSKIK